ncbi:DUF2306 domain-containing protein [Jannaschia aquimarina]|uniref:Membrane protein (DUF2306) n=1 Tax=Jannaschia aquimarina TaxID=935700 RepID=A0A0D1CRQ7_9RHOB|nr:DUF2306 domain-containing protein [Jannaschia aquimarina]KIT17482.1 hypothetical protein jaqu_06700 [Jannaschia aquimarina]SNS74911.1 Predicted membrane protein [Jannaschia aquimarina]
MAAIRIGSVLLLMLAVLPFGLYSLLRGAALGTPDEVASRLFHEDALAPTAALYLHMVAGGALSILAPLQLLGAVRRRWPAIHRGTGRVTLGLAGITGLGGLIYIGALGTIGGLWMSFGFALYGALVIAVAWATWRSAVDRSPTHPDWAARMVVLALGSWLYRVQYGLWELGTGGIGVREDFTGWFDRIQVLAFYLPWLMALELWLARRRSHAFP